MNVALLIAAIAVRNPFWPIGYEGAREMISAEPTVDVKVAASAEDETATAATAARSSQTVSDRHWAEARKTLRIGGTAVVTNPDGTRSQCIMINGLAYGDGDLISVNHGNKRFTWRVVGLTKGETVKLQRVRARANPDAPGQKNPKENAK
ncbi:MAG: hypothetical protein IJ829_08855 [Kiritimatiellae bacterium]|nr:hypothetical protein [Kiritimatiellia bacterium]